MFHRSLIMCLVISSCMTSALLISNVASNDSCLQSCIWEAYSTTSHMKQSIPRDLFTGMCGDINLEKAVATCIGISCESKAASKTLKLWKSECLGSRAENEISSDDFVALVEQGVRSRVSSHSF